MAANRTQNIDIFYQSLFNFGTLQLVADVTEDTARLQLTDGQYGNTLSLVINKSAAFVFFHNASIHTFSEVASMLSLMGAKSK